MRCDRLLFLIAVVGVLAVPVVKAQLGPQDNWVVDPEERWSVPGCLSIAMDDVHAYVSLSTHEISVYTLDGVVTTNFGSGGSEDGQFNSPIALAVDDEYLYVDDYGNNRIQVLTKEGSYVRKWGSSGSALGQFNYPTGVAVDTQNVYVADSQNHRIQVFTKDGDFVRAWGSQGSVLGQFDLPNSVAVDDDHVYVSERTNKRVQVFLKDGTFVRSWLIGGGIGLVNCPLAVDAQRVYVGLQGEAVYMSGQYAGFQIFTKQGEVVWSDVKHYNPGPSYDLGWFAQPRGIALRNPVVYMADAGHQSILKMRQIYRTLGALEENSIPLVDIRNVAQREGTAILDVDYMVSDRNDATVTVYAAAFTGDTSPSLSNIVPMLTFVGDTATNVGPGISVGTLHRLTWDMESDGIDSKIADYGDLDVSLFVKDNRGLVDLHFLSIPQVGGESAFQINRSPLKQQDFLPVWFWLLASGDTDIDLLNGQVYGTPSSSYEGTLLAEGTNTFDEGRAFLYDRMNVRAASSNELRIAREGETADSVHEWTPRRQPPPEGYKVNEFNFVTDPTNGWWVVPL